MLYCNMLIIQCDKTVTAIGSKAVNRPVLSSGIWFENSIIFYTGSFCRLFTLHLNNDKYGRPHSFAVYPFQENKIDRSAVHPTMRL